MKDKIINLLSSDLSKINIFVHDVVYKKEKNMNTLEIILDSSEILDINKIVEATNIINPILDKEDLIKEEYILDVYALSKEV